MTSKIPHLKTTTHSSSPIATSQHPPKDPTTIHASFVALGAPHLTPEEFTRLYHGPLANALLFLSEHVIGRKGVTLARDQIQTLRETRNNLKSGLRPPDDATRSVADKAASRLSGAKKAVETYRKQLDGRQAALEMSQAELEGLQSQLDSKRRVGLLLGVLERKEGLRVKRFEEVTRLLDKLRKAVDESKSQHLPFDRRLEGEPVLHPDPALLPLRTTHIQDTMSTLHAHHIHLSRIVSQSNAKDTNRSLSHLRKAATRHLNITGPNAEADELLDKFIALARTRGKQNVRYQGMQEVSRPVPSRAELSILVEANETKEQELQNLSDLSMALVFLSEHFIKSMLRFLKTTSHTVRSSIDEESSQAKGYVDVLRWLVVSTRRHGETEVDGKSFGQEVKSACGLKGNAAFGTVIKKVKDVIQDAHQRATFLDNAAMLPPIPSTEEQDTLITSYKNNTQNMQKRTVELLTRKVDKAEMGYSLVKDVEVLIREARFVVQGKE